MIKRENLMERTEKILDETGFRYCKYSGCFDIAAKKKGTFLIKILINIDSFQQEHSKELRIISDDLSASPVVVGLQTNYEKLQDNIIYERFKIPTMTPCMLENILLNNMPDIFRFRGGLFSEINAVKLRNARMEKGFTQKKLAEKVGVSKKNIYEHEAEDKPAALEIVKKIEDVLDCVVTNHLSITGKVIEDERLMPENKFEKSVGNELNRLGFSTDFFKRAHFNLIAKEKTIIIAHANESEKNTEKTIQYMLDFSKITKTPVLAITPEEKTFDIPTIYKKELSKMSSSRELLEAIR